MKHILKRSALSVASVLSQAFLLPPVLVLLMVALGGCAGTSLPSIGGDRSGEEESAGEANEVVDAANAAISEHDRLFEEARGLYGQSLRAIEDEGTTEREARREAERLGRARETMGEARAQLVEAQEALGRVEGLDVAPELKEYARRLSEAAKTRSEAEAREMEYYRILERDPFLREDRRRALNTLDEAREGYSEADRAFDRAEQLASDNPDLFRGGG
jgi:hypothetical protein